MLELARRALGRLSAVPLPREGSLTFVPTPAAAAEGVELVQESAPERLELKQALLAEACAAAGAGVLIASSTSGLRPTALAAEMGRPERFLVAHPFNPVYLLPLVELCGGERTSAEAIERARALYGSLGMAPLVVRKEIDGFVADRMLEALWREALWLVNDGVATAAEVDDAIRLGAGLRWSFMGTFLTYRIAGGEAGMRHFMAQFGPALKWPWTKLMDVPDLTDELIDEIVAQSDEQAEGRSVRELEQLRDDCLVSVLQALRAHDIGAGAVLARHEQELAAAASARVMGDGDDLSRAARAAHGAGRPRLGRLQRPRAREPLPAGLRRRLRRALRLPRHRRGVSDDGQLLHGREPPLPPARGAARRPALGHDAGARLGRAQAAGLPLALARGRRGAARDRRAALPARRHGCPARGACSGRRCWNACSGSPRRMPRCRVPSVRAARSPSRAEASVRSRRR